MGRLFQKYLKIPENNQNGGQNFRAEIDVMGERAKKTSCLPTD